MPNMLQLSPNLYCRLANHDKMAAKLKRLFPRKIAYPILQNILYTIVFYNPSIIQKMKNFIINGAKGLGDFPVDPHFIPNYNPWNNVLYCAKR
jgi:hypothetical protein